MIRCHCLLLTGLLLTGSLLGASPAAMALRCDGRVVSQDAHAVQVRERCGEPYWIDQFSEIEIVGEDGPLEQRSEHLVEVWYYNFGPNKLLRQLLFVDDRLRSEQSLGYGFAQLGRDCRLDALPVQTAAGVIVARCGLPSSRRERYVERTERDRRGLARRRLVRNEEWIYDLGDHRDLRLLRIVDGHLQDSERLDR